MVNCHSLLTVFSEFQNNKCVLLCNKVTFESMNQRRVRGTFRPGRFCRWVGMGEGWLHSCHAAPAPASGPDPGDGAASVSQGNKRHAWWLHHQQSAVPSFRGQESRTKVPSGLVSSWPLLGWQLHLLQVLVWSFLCAQGPGAWLSSYQVASLIGLGLALTTSF